ncbi:MAG TPA: hypothetical protein VJ777_17885 [Mycobacterium sp.]|nr:hypothetical protein [Mycobacterium sp.]
MRRRGAVYGIPTLPVDADGRVVAGPVWVGYIGKTVQTVKQREEQHRETQSFGDTIVGGSWTIEEGHWTEDHLAAREEYWIRNGVVLVPGQVPQRPVYNYEHNLENPDRIEIWRAVEHRQLRDREAGIEPGWQQPSRDGRVPWQRAAARRVVPRAAPAPSALARWWGRRRWWVIGLSALWLALFAVGCRLVSPLLDADSTALAAACGASAPFVLVQGEIWRRRVRAWWRRVTRPKRRTRGRRR